ncbi:MAG TPA: hypothetical protein VFO83_00865 [Aggregicoccus sp.]|nr:hypothetical protein [Aggregicoccus sp.]
MYHLLRLGPVPLSEGSVHVYLRIADSGDFAPPVFAPADEAGAASGLTQLLEGVEPAEVRCEPALAGAAAPFGILSAVPPAAALAQRAAIATFMAWGQRGLAGLGSDKALLLLQAAAEFWEARPWQRWDDAQPFDVRVSGPLSHTYEGSVFGQGEQDVGLALYVQPGALRTLTDLQGHGHADAARRLPAIAVTLDDKPAYATEALAAAGRVPRVPLPLKTGPAGIGLPSAVEVLVLVATLRAVARLSPEQREAVSQVVAPDGEMRVRVLAPPPRVKN